MMKNEYFANIKNSVSSIFEGLAVTASWMFRRPCTVQYPDKIEKPIEEELPERYRGLLEVDLAYCTACMACEKACPIECISIDLVKNAETKERHLVKFDIDAAKCMYCGLCVEACKFESIRHTSEFAASNANLDNLILRFIPEGEKIVPRKAKGDPPPVTPKGEIIKRHLKPCFPEKGGL
jgi:formate hydrogenlyase subunit 6/NADH:ubiquinone oxidoreductase subunit I